MGSRAQSGPVTWVNTGSLVSLSDFIREWALARLQGPALKGSWNRAISVSLLLVPSSAPPAFLSSCSPTIQSLPPFLGRANFAAPPGLGGGRLRTAECQSPHPVPVNFRTAGSPSFPALAATRRLELARLHTPFPARSHSLFRRAPFRGI